MFRTKQLIILGGPSCVGKSTLLARIQRGDCPHLCAQLGIDQPASWEHIGANRIPAICQPVVERLFVHQDIYGLFLDVKSQANLREIITESDRCTTVTLYASMTALKLRLRQRLSSKIREYWLHRSDLFGHIRRIPEVGRIQLAKRRVYSDTSRLMQVYDLWFEQIVISGTSCHFAINTTEPDVSEAHPLVIDDVKRWLVESAATKQQPASHRQRMTGP